MKPRLILAIVLIAGISMGASGTYLLCNAGYCGDDNDALVQTSAPQPATQPDPTMVATQTFSAAGDPSGPSAASGENDSTALRDWWRSQRATKITGLAINADSTADEYRADNPRGGDFGDTTFNWVELLARERGVNLGEWSDNRPEPRRGGYEFNSARSGATSQTLIDSGQHTLAAQQLASGAASHVIIQIGINDFWVNDVSFEIYDGNLSGDELKAFLDKVVANVELAVATVSVAGQDRVILAATQDYVTPALLPEVHTLLTDEAGRQRLSNAFAYLNAGLREMAARNDVHFFDFNAALQRELEARYDPQDQRFFLVGDQRIDLESKGDAPRHAFIGDEYAHPGTVLSGIFTNLFIREMNAVFGTYLLPLTDNEILQAASLQAAD